jgi:hypothetical protein
MEKIKKINLFAIGLPIIILITYPIFNEGAIAFSILSTMITGLIQVLISFQMILEKTNNKHLQIYIISVIVFFCLCYVNSLIDCINFLTYILITFPPILAIYLTIIIYKEIQNENLA